VRLWSLAKSKPLGVASLLIIVVFVFTAFSANYIAPHNPVAMDGDAVLSPPNATYVMGTDHFGRDVFSRILHGARISLIIGVGSIVLALVMGVSIGMVSAYFMGRLDMILQRVMDAAQAFPGIVFALAIIAVLGPGLINVMVAIAVTLVPRNNRIVRGSVLSEKNNVYVEAARAIGNGGASIMWKHILPNVTAPIIIIGATELGGAILTEASLSFLGVGIPPPNPSWGSMLSGEHRTYMLVAPWMAVFPGAAISLAVLGWNLFGDALRDVWDPRLRGR
jgi:ABC-type dipeptide/oligopeptide/nickel transport system permease subunit